MSMMRGLIDIRPEERRNTFAAFSTLLLITTGHTLLETARDALFLSKLPASQLPWMYLVIVALALALSRIRRADSKPAIIIVLLTAAVVTAGFWVLVGGGTTPWVLYALYVFSGLFASWVMVQFWTLLGRAHTMTQAKRLYGFIGAGAVLGGVVGAFGARAALMMLPPRAMLIGSAGLFVLSALPVFTIQAPESTEVHASSSASTGMMTGTTLLWQNAFAKSILGIVFIATVSVTLVDYLFKMKLAATYVDTRELAARLSTFYAVTNTVSLVAQLFVGPWVFRSFGVQRALFFFPALLLGGAGAVLVSGGRLIAAVLAKGLDGTFRYSLHKTSTELLLVPIPDGTRERIKPIVELLGSRGGQAIASVVILLLVALGVASPATLSAFIITLSVLWLAIVVRIRGHYLDVFRETLRSGGLSGKVELPQLDLGALETLFAGLNSSRDPDVLASLELLAEQHRERLIPALILYHPSRDVVLRALDIFTQRGRADFVSIADRLDGHPDREVAAAALRARTVVAPDRKLLYERLEGPCAQVSATALIALVARGWIDSQEADLRLRAIIARRSWPIAIALARSIHDLGGHIDESVGAKRMKDIQTCFDELLIKLAREANQFHELSQEDARDEARLADVTCDVRIRLEVARAMAERESPSFLPILVGMLNRHELRSTARSAIARIPGALDFVDEVMGQRDYARDVRVHLPRTMVLFQPDLAARKLMAHLLVEKDGAVRFKVLRGLLKLRRSDPSLFLEPDVLRRSIEHTLDHAEALRRWDDALGLSADEEKGPITGRTDPLRAAHHLLKDLVRDKASHAVQRIFMLLELIHAEDFEDIERGLRSKKPKTRANSLELIENLVRPPLRQRVLTLVGDRLPGENAMTYEDAVRAILLESTSTTMKLLAEYRALELGMDTIEITGGRVSQPPTMESIGKRLVDRARDLLVPEPEVTRAPA
jgi:ATP:ADP antiporter, AAA family